MSSNDESILDLEQIPTPDAVLAHATPSLPPEELAALMLEKLTQLVTTNPGSRIFRVLESFFALSEDAQVGKDRMLLLAHAQFVFGREPLNENDQGEAIAANLIDTMRPGLIPLIESMLPHAHRAYMLFINDQQNQKKD
jgi:hypothetical protein